MCFIICPKSTFQETNLQYVEGIVLLCGRKTRHPYGRFCQHELLFDKLMNQLCMFLCFYAWFYFKEVGTTVNKG